MTPQTKPSKDDEKPHLRKDHCGSFHKVVKVFYLVQSAQIATQSEQSGN
jgi:hypothetical protein